MFIIAFLFLSSVASAQSTMTMTTSKTDWVTIGLSGRGMALIDWGFGAPPDTVALPADGARVFRQSRYDMYDRTITITGDAVTGLRVSGNLLTHLDVSRNSALTDLYCSNNRLTALDISRNRALKVLWCRDNQLTALDAGNNRALTDLDCNDNRLTALDVRRNRALTALDCGNNQLSAVALNRLFGTLHKKRLSAVKFLFHDGNPGSVDANWNIAYKKGWSLQVFDDDDDDDGEEMFKTGVSHFSEREYEQAREWFCKAAEKGHAPAMNLIGHMYYFGHGVDEDFGKAREWYSKSAALGNANAMYQLGNIYFYGMGVAADSQKAREWYAKAAEKGHQQAKEKFQN